MTDAALHRLAPIARAIVDATGRSADTWLVGGVVRDALLERELLDLDLVVRGDVAGTARAYAKSIGGSAFPLSDRFGCWRVVEGGSGDTPDAVQLDVCELRGESLADDLALRDFTINAMAVDCHAPDALIDTTGGLDDLRERQLRVVSAQAVIDDPLRMLRAARIAHALGFSIERDTCELIRANAALAVEPSGERTFVELCLLLEGGEARRGIRLLDELGLVDVLLPELARCRGIEQSRFHHLDVFEHTLAVLDNCEDIAAEPEHYFGPAPDGAAVALHRRVLLFGALCHDLGKPDTHLVHASSGRVSFVGHDSAGLVHVDAMCDRWSTSNELRDAVKLLVRTHLALGMLLHEQFDARASWRFRRRVEPWCAEAITLSLGDRQATAGVDDRRRWMRLHKTVARQLWADHWSEVRDGRPAPLLDGLEIAQACEIEPGPQLGKLVRVLEEAQAVGDVTSREQALVHVRAACEATSAAQG